MNIFYIWMANWKPFENMLILLFQQRFFIFNNFRKWHLCIGRQKSLFFSKCNFEPLIIEFIIFSFLDIFEYFLDIFN